MAIQEGTEDVYASLLLTDNYLPGALVLAHSLRDAGTTKKLAILVTADTVSSEVIEQLKTVYDYVIPVERVKNEHPANLFLMNRPDLHSAFTKVNLWKLTQFRKIVYVDADVVAYRAPDELFDLPHAFSAAPDIGWPDLFNTGVMALTPNMGDYYALVALAERGISFDGADQGLLNMHFKNTFNRISFSYNVTPSAHYQYVPAYKHLQSTISMVHFIGSDKPWTQGRQQSTGNSPFTEMAGKWWAVFDRHYRKEDGSTPHLVQYFVKGEFNPTTTVVIAPPPEPKIESWDASKQSPPSDSKPEAANFPQAHYGMSRDKAPYVASDQYLPPVDRPKPIFPWEANQPKPTRVFAERPLDPLPPKSPSLATSTAPVVQQNEPTTPPPANLAAGEASADASAAQGNTWTNAWDEDPSIDKYVSAISSKHSRTRSQGLGVVPTTPPQKSGASLKVTDFPSETERPSLPVTPAPHSRPPNWATGTSEDGDGDQLPAADGVPEQAEWDPLAQLDKLAHQHSEALLEKLGTVSPQEETIGIRGQQIPSRPVPFGSEGAKSPTYVSPSPVVSPVPVKPASSTSTSKILSTSSASTSPPTSTLDKGKK